MEIALISKDVIKIRGKRASLVVDPINLGVKTAADAILLFHDSTFPTFPKIEESRLTIYGAGDYEVSGIKISSIGSKDCVVYTVGMDLLSLLLTESKVLKKLQGDLGESQVVVIRANEPLDASRVAALSPRVVILYGEHALEIAKSLGKEGIVPVSKYATTLEKLPEEMEIVVLG